MKLTVYAHLLLFGRLFLHLDKFLENLFRHWRGSIAAMTAMFDQYGDGDLGILHRRIGDKPSMIAAEVCLLLGLHVAALHLDDLGRAGFTGDVDDRLARHAAG